MAIKIRTSNIIALFIVATALCFAADAQTVSPRTFSEVFVMRSLRQIHSAQVTYNATYGNGNFGSLQNLHQAGFIDEALSSGSKYGYTFVVTFVPYTPPSTPSTFTVTATPRSYRKTGLRSFFIATEGILRGADRQGGPANQDDPPVN